MSASSAPLRAIPGSQRGQNCVWILLIVLAILSGGLYASFLPPWGLIDEEQHVHYIQYIAEKRALPTTKDTYLSEAIVESLFETRRWAKFHWPAPPSQDPRQMGLEGHSYEAYQPPLFYVLFSIPFSILPGSILLKLYVLRWLMVLLSSVTPLVCYRVMRVLMPKAPSAAYLATLLLIAIPERVAATSRVNNDVLLEVISAFLVLVAAQTLMSGLTARRSRLLGLLFGLGVLTKTSAGVLLALVGMVFLLSHRNSGWWHCLFWFAGVAGLLILPFVVRNLVLYGDLTGFAGFAALNANYGVVSPPEVSMETVLRALWDLLGNYWVVWWKGAAVGRNPLITGAAIFLAACVVIAAYRVLATSWRERRRLADQTQLGLLLSFLVVVVGCAVAVLFGYAGGSIPVIQGRFFLPVVVPAVCLFTWALYQSPYPLASGLILWLMLSILGWLSLFGNLLPYHYFWSDVVLNGTGSIGGLSPSGVWGIFCTNLMQDKPALVQSLLPLILITYVFVLVLTGATMWRRAFSTNVTEIE